MIKRMNATFDTAIGGLLVVAAIAFAVVGFWSGLASNAHSNQWYISALTLGVLGGAVLLDELGAGRSDRRFDAIIGTLLLLGALGMGTVGWIAGMADNSRAMIWQVSGLVLAILAMTAMVDELRRLHTIHGLTNSGFSGLAILFGLIGLGLGVVGFIVGLADNSHAMTWLFGGVVSSTVALAWDFEAEHREALIGQPEGEPVMRPMGTPRAMEQ